MNDPVRHRSRKRALGRIHGVVKDSSGNFAMVRHNSRKYTIRTRGFYAPGEMLAGWLKEQMRPIGVVKHIDPKTGKVVAIYNPNDHTRTLVGESGA